MNLFDAKLVKEGERYAVALGDIKVELSEEKQKRLSANGVEAQEITLGVRPEHIALEGGQMLEGVVDVYEMMGSEIHYHVSYEGQDIIIIVPTINNAIVPMGEKIGFTFGGNVAHVFNKETGANLEV